MKSYTINRYYGGEFPEDVLHTDTLDEAYKHGQGAEHYTITSNWYEVGVSYKNDGGTETIASEQMLRKAMKIGTNLKEFLADTGSQYGHDLMREIDFVFIDKWWCEVEVVKVDKEGNPKQWMFSDSFKDEYFKTIIIKHKN